MKTALQYQLYVYIMLKWKGAETIYTQPSQNTAKSVTIIDHTP